MTNKIPQEIEEKIIREVLEEVEQNLDFTDGFREGRLYEREKVLKLIEDWKRNSILKYDDDCPYCQRHISNTIIQAKELFSKIGEEKQNGT